MKWCLKSSAWVWIAIFITGATSCKKQGEGLKSDLGEAGYKMTTDDWFRASSGNDAAALKKFIAGGFKADTRNSVGDSALHAAAAAGAQSSADFLLNRGLSVDLRGASDRTPLMAAVTADQTAMVRWLLRQGADPRAKDKDGFMPIMLAVRDGSAGSVAELAPYNREDLDSALLLAALVGRADVIDSLTNYGASVYARMEDGRTPLMIAAENGHSEAVKLLIEIGASRYTTNPEGRTAADIAKAAGHDEIAALITREPLPDELALETTEKIAESMDEFVNDSIAKASPVPASGGGSPADAVSPSIDGKTLSAPVAALDGVKGAAPSKQSVPSATATSAFPIPPLVMRHYRERELPLSVKSVQGDTATVSVAGVAPRQMKVRVGEVIPGSRLSIVSVRRRMEDSKVNAGRPTEISVVDVRDSSTGATREWITGLAAKAHDPVALVEDAATGKRYLAAPGQRFKGADGTEYIVSDVRPNQIVIENSASGAVQTLPLRGPRG
jgi:ankyrin repeat protein